ncbi:hypothetical protein ABBQ38_008602 [Trebouxia sp. C0009 RCD-2024]
MVATAHLSMEQMTQVQTVKGVKDNKRRRAEERQRSILESCNPKEAVAGQEKERELGKGKKQAVDHGKSTVEEQQQAGNTDLGIGESTGQDRGAKDTVQKELQEMSCSHVCPLIEKTQHLSTLT